jgi:hypothetical protein
MDSSDIQIYCQELTGRFKSILQPLYVIIAGDGNYIEARR